jgi:hypothetical protein
MGIKNLNKVLRTKCKNSIKKISFSDLSGKKIAIDISIYLYKYSFEEALIENIFLMISLFYYYNITPIFIFDGKPPIEKKELLIKRLNEKKEAEKDYSILKNNIKNGNISIDKKEEAMNQLNILQKQCFTLKKNNISTVKELIISYGASYIDAIGEADELCVRLVLTNQVWACLSEDTDMFVYGCPRVLRYISLLNHTAVLYDLENILYELRLNLFQFREICILSGTDYNASSYSIEKLIYLYEKYIHLKLDYNSITFYDWLFKNYNLSFDCNLINNIKNMFDLSNKNISKDELDIIYSKKSDIRLKEILIEDGFIFP